jgi:hypothetical protein
MVTDPPPDEFERRTRELFENSVERLDAHTRSKLTQARNAALNEANKASIRRYWLAAPLGGLAAAVVLAVFLVSGRDAATRGDEAGALPLDDFDIVADADNFEIILDVEFYSWLAEQGGGDGNSSTNSG